MSTNSNDANWLFELLGIQSLQENETVKCNGQTFTLLDGILREQTAYTNSQKQTSDIFGYKWARRETYDDSDACSQKTDSWLIEKYGSLDNMEWFNAGAGQPIVMDAGCGAGVSGLLYFSKYINQIKYLGVDVSKSIDTAKVRFVEKNANGQFLQCSLMNIPLPKNSVDIIFSEGVLHHTDSTEEAIQNLSPYLKSGGRFMFYVYKKKGPIREYTDDYIREKIQDLSPEEAWKALEPLSMLGKHLGELDIEIDVPENIDLLNIPAGKINLQRFFYWHIFKAFYRSDFSFDEMNHINFDWYAPTNAHRQTIEEVRTWCEVAGLEIEKEHIEEAGITIIARKS